MTASDQTDDIHNLGIPEDALRRLAEMRPGSATTMFTSDLSVNEFLLVREAGFRPLGLVLGSSIYHVGFQMRSVGQEPGARGAFPGDVPRARARHDPHGSRG